MIIQVMYDLGLNTNTTKLSATLHYRKKEYQEKILNY